MKMIGVSLSLLSWLASLEAFTVCVEDFDERTNVKIGCELSHQRLHANFSRVQLTVGEISRLTIHYCGAPEDGTRLRDAIDSMGVRSVTALEIKDPKTPLTREFLRGISVDTLELDTVDAADLPSDLLRDVEVRRNLIFHSSAIPGIPAGFFRHASSIESLEIAASEPVKLRGDELASLAGLRRLTLGENRRVEIGPGVFDGLERLEIMDLSHNRLGSLPAGVFRRLKNLRELYLGVNKLNEIPADLLRIEDSKLQVFRMSNAGNIKALPAAFFRDLRNLQVVQLSNNKLSSLPADLFAGAVSLKKVMLNLNKIARLPAGIFDEATELKELDLSGNELTSLPENIFRKNKLQKLNLDKNRISNLTENNLNGLDNLEILSFANNPLKNIDLSLCNKLKSLKSIKGLRGCESFEGIQATELPEFYK